MRVSNKMMTDNIILYDDNSKIYPLFGLSIPKLQFEDPHDLTSSKALVEGSILTLVFEIPLQSNLASIEYTYYYGSSWAEYDASSRATIIIDFLNIYEILSEFVLQSERQIFFI